MALVAVSRMPIPVSWVPKGWDTWEQGGRPCRPVLVGRGRRCREDLARTVPSITIQVLPHRVGAHAGMDGPFMLMSFPNGRDLVCIESMRAALHLNKPEAVEAYRTTSDLLKSGSPVASVGR
jgi:hypothetical protein